jgi:hypothetical protein
MATAKPGKRSKSPTQTPAARKRSAPASTGPSLDAVRATIAALRRNDYPEKLNASVRDLIFAAQRLRDSAVKLREPLLAKSRLDPAVLDSFSVRIAVLDQCEEAWQTARGRGVPVALSRARTAAAELRRDAITTLRHFLEDDGSVQIKLDEIVEGEGDVDLVDDLKKLATLVDAHWTTIARSGDMPAEKGDALRKAAAVLNDARLGNESSPEASKAMELRDKAFFYLLEAEREIRACGKHAFRKEPKVATLFADLLFAARSASGASNDEKRGEPRKPE